MNWLEQREAGWLKFVAELEAWQAQRFPQVCLKDCGHHCCNLKDTKLLAPKEEIAVLIGYEPDDWSAYESDEPGLYRFSAGDCPHYDRASKHCKIWNDVRRPPICKEFPFGLYRDNFYGDQKVYVSPACAFDPAFEAWGELERLCLKHQVALIRLNAA